MDKLKLKTFFQQKNMCQRRSRFSNISLVDFRWTKQANNNRCFFLKESTVQIKLTQYIS